MRLATQADFHGGSQYTDYRRYPFFSERAAIIRQRFPAATSVLIAGCGYGYLVDELQKLGINAWGCDASPYATGRAAQELGQNGRFVLQGDCTTAAGMTAVRAAALGGGANRRFAVCVTEDLLPALADIEVTATLTALRGVSTTLFHIITPGNPSDHAKVDKAMNWKSISEWKALVGADPIVNTETWEVV